MINLENALNIQPTLKFPVNVLLQYLNSLCNISKTKHCFSEQVHEHCSK